MISPTLAQVNGTAKADGELRYGQPYTFRFRMTALLGAERKWSLSPGVAGVGIGPPHECRVHGVSLSRHG
jgi:hypothetical protein